jgi:outer membrane protein assembly factor BamA
MTGLFSFALVLNALLPMADTTQQVVVQNITLTGNYRTRERIVRRELAIHTGDTLHSSQIDSLLAIERRKILNTNLFVTVDIQKKISTDSSASILKSLPKMTLNVILKEQWYLLAFPVLQLADRNFNEWWYERGRDLSRVIYGGYMSHHNFSGNNDRLRLLAEFGFVPHFEMSYSLPYIDKAQRTGIALGLSYISNKTIAYRTNADKLVFFASETRTRQRFTPFVTISHRPKFYGYHSLTLGFVSALVSDTLLKLNSRYIDNTDKNQHYTSLTYTHQFDRRDRGQYPLQGYFYVLQVSRTGLLASDSWKQWELNITGAKYYPLSKRWFVSTSAKVKLSTRANQPYSQIRGMGYSGDLVRGYELYVIDGQHFGIARLNLRYQMMNRVFLLNKIIKIRQFNTFPLAIYPNVYLDGGYVYNKFSVLNNSRLANRPLVGAGIGLDFVTWYNFVFRINYSVNHLGESRPYFVSGRDY